MCDLSTFWWAYLAYAVIAFSFWLVLINKYEPMDIFVSFVAGITWPVVILTRVIRRFLKPDTTVTHK